MTARGKTFVLLSTLLHDLGRRSIILLWLNVNVLHSIPLFHWAQWPKLTGLKVVFLRHFEIIPDNSHLSSHLLVEWCDLNLQGAINSFWKVVSSISGVLISCPAWKMCNQTWISEKKTGKIIIVATQSSEPGAKVKFENYREFQVNLQKMPNELVFILEQDFNWIFKLK